MGLAMWSYPLGSDLVGSNLGRDVREFEMMVSRGSWEFCSVGGKSMVLVYGVYKVVRRPDFIPLGGNQVCGVKKFTRRSLHRWEEVKR